MKKTKVAVNKKPHPIGVERMYGLRGQSNHPLGNALQIYNIYTIYMEIVLTFFICKINRQNCIKIIINFNNRLSMALSNTKRILNDLLPNVRKMVIPK